MNDHIAFLDEWGNDGLDFTKRGVSTHFIVTAVTLRKDQLNEAKTQLEAVRKRYFQNGPNAEIESVWLPGATDLLDREEYANLKQLLS